MPESERGIRLRSSAQTNMGQVRENNEDNVHLSVEQHYVLAIVADGMGGAAAGEEASRLAVEVIYDQLLNSVKSPSDLLENLQMEDATAKLSQAIERANQVIMNHAVNHPEFKGMGTTVTMAYVRGTEMALAHVGDSRAYLVDGDTGIIHQLTLDHSFVQALLSAGHITQEEAEEHPMRNVLYRALGQDKDMEVDVAYQELRIGDRLVLCSDGLTRHVRPQEIAKLVIENDDPNQASQSLIDLANARGGEDNVSVIVIVVEEDEMGAYDDGYAAQELDEYSDTHPHPQTDEHYYPQDSDEGSNFQARMNWPPVLSGSQRAAGDDGETPLQTAREGQPRLEQRSSLRSGAVQRPDTPLRTPFVERRSVPALPLNGAAEGRDTRTPDQ